MSDYVRPTDYVPLTESLIVRFATRAVAAGCRQFKLQTNDVIALLKLTRLGAEARSILGRFGRRNPSGDVPVVMKALLDKLPNVISHVSTWRGGNPFIKQQTSSTFQATCVDIVHDLLALRSARPNRVFWNVPMKGIAVRTDEISFTVASEKYVMGELWIVVTPGGHVSIYTSDEDRWPVESHGLIHPHVNHNRLCFGEGLTAFNGAASELRFGDIVEIADTVLHTYARGQAYRNLDQWLGERCSGCRGRVPAEHSRCVTCSTHLCGGCAVRCEGENCNKVFCATHAAAGLREVDGHRYCQGCIHTCSKCGCAVARADVIVTRSGCKCPSCYRVLQAEAAARRAAREAQIAQVASVIPVPATPAPASEVTWQILPPASPTPVLRPIGYPTPAVPVAPTIATAPVTDRMRGTTQPAAPRGMMICAACEASRLRSDLVLHEGFYFCPDCLPTAVASTASV